MEGDRQDDNQSPFHYQGGLRIKKVLIVDDSEAVLDVVSEVVSASGFKPLTASGGKEALEKTRSERPDLILLDLNMPDIDGWTVLRKMKEEGHTNETKVMVLTATADVSADIFGLQDVVSGYIRKPFDNKELSDRLKNALEQSSAEKEESSRIREWLDHMRTRPATDGMEKARRSAKKHELRRGFCYVFEEQKPNLSFEIFVDQVTHNIQGLCITRQHPKSVRNEWSLEETPIFWLSNQQGEVNISPTSIRILGEVVIRFIEISDDSVVLIDGIEFLIRKNGFYKVLGMLDGISEVVMEHESRLIIPVDPRTLEGREMALLERNMEVILPLQKAR